jgi:ferredoxin
MKVRIDGDMCTGQGRCFSIAPDVFGFDDLGNGTVLVAGDLSEQQLAAAQLAQSNCPEHAIFIED